MRPPIPRFVRWTVVLAVVAALAISVFQHWDTRQIRQVASGTSPDGWTQTAWGPLGPADRIMLEKVRQAGLWETSMGELAQQKASSRRVREVGGLLSAGNRELAAQVSATAEKLGVTLPSRPSEQQQSWMTQISSKSGSDLDRAFVQRLRAAHGQVLPLLTQVRSGTRNEVIRSFAANAAVVVTRHQQYLENAKLADFAAPPEPTLPTPPATAIPTATAAAVTPTATTPTAATAAVYTVALVYVAVPLAAGGLLWLLVTGSRRARPVPYRPQPLPAPRSHSEPLTQTPSRRAMHATSGVATRPRHAAQRR